MQLSMTITLFQEIYASTASHIASHLLLIFFSCSTKRLKFIHWLSTRLYGVLNAMFEGYAGCTGDVSIL